MTTTATREAPAEIANPAIRQLLAPQNRPALEALITEERPLPPPICLTVDLTHRCNANCASCIERDGMAHSRHADLPAQDAFRLVTDSVEAGVKAWGLYGGEPLLHPAFSEVLLAAVEQGLFVSLVTNGFLLGRPPVALALKRAAADGRLRSVPVSLNAATPDVHAGHFRVGRDRFEHTVAACRELVTAGVPLSVSYLVDTDNYQDLVAGARVALAEIGAHRLYVRLATGLHGIGAAPFAQQDRATMLLRIRELRSEWGQRVAVPASFVELLRTQRLRDTQQECTWRPFCLLCAIGTPPGPGQIWACTYFRGVPRFQAGRLPLAEWVRSADRRRAALRISPRKHCASVNCNKRAANRWLHGLRERFVRSGSVPDLPSVPAEAPFFPT